MDFSFTFFFFKVMEATGKSAKRKRSRQAKKQKIESECVGDVNQLPIYAVKAHILETISKNNIVILVGETGSGKTTQLPQYLLEFGFASKGMICITQPRRVAAISIATRVASELKTKVGGLVGYSIRFEDKTDKSTRVKYMTDGMLLRELLTDDLLSKYSVIILDEVHERTLRTDVLFGSVKRILDKRSDLKVVIMSATMNAQKFSDYFNRYIHFESSAQIINVPGRQFPVKILYAPHILDDYVDSCLVTIFQLHKGGKGDVLCFLTGQEEIENLEKLVTEQARGLPEEADKVCNFNHFRIYFNLIKSC